MCLFSVVDCGPLGDIPRGRVELTTTTFGSNARYVCEPGFSIVGASIRTCLAVGVWSGREPTCRRKHIPFSTQNYFQKCFEHLNLSSIDVWASRQPTEWSGHHCRLGYRCPGNLQLQHWVHPEGCGLPSLSSQRTVVRLCTYM